MENQMTSLKCRKCGAPISADQKKCSKCGAPILLKVMMEEEKRHLPAKEIREKDKRMRKEYAKMNKEKELEKQKAEKKQQIIDEKAEKKLQKTKKELELVREKEEKRAKQAEEKAARQKAKEEAAANKKAQKEAAKTDKNSKIGLICGIIFAVIVLAAAAVYMLNRPEKEEPEIEAIEEVVEPAEEIPAEVTEEPEQPAETEEPAEPAPEQPVEETPKAAAAEQKPKRNITRNNYLFPSDTQYLTEADLNGLSQFDTGLIRNEIYAKKGYVFKDEPYKSYFNSQAWYNPNPSAKMRLNETEKYNVNFLLEYERAQGWR